MFSLSRRRFLKGAVLTGTAALFQDTGSQDPKSLTKIFEGVQLQDQYGKDFNPAELFKDRSALVMFGYGGCQMCQKIGVTAAAIQAEIDSRNEKIAEENKKLPDEEKKPLIDLSIVVVSVKPADDRFKEGENNPMKDYVGSYAGAGVRQAKAKETSYEDGKALPQSERILHLVTTQDGMADARADARYNFPQTIQSRLAAQFPRTNFFNPSDPESHSPYITLFKNGVATKTERALPSARDLENSDKLQEHAKVCAKTLVDAALIQQTARGR